MIKKPLTVAFLVLLLPLSLMANENKPDAKKGEGDYNLSGSPTVRIFDVGEKNVANDIPTSIEGKVRNISGQTFSLVTVDVAFYEKDMTRIAIVSDSIQSLADKEVARFKVDEPEGTFHYRVMTVHTFK